ncbi:MAG: thiol-disulfide oxidoreductase DCC family protein [Saprospiraceae bacterium]|nr:thiol-disulfide oxidoreductase DCC family protein [Saprospiraceae bacterium]
MEQLGDDLSTHSVLLFDGVCNLCNGFVQFVIQRDKEEKFKFAPLQSEIAAQLLAGTVVQPYLLNSVVLVEGKRVYTHSDAALLVGKRLGGIWFVLSSLAAVFPTSFRNVVYNWIAKNRYRWFGKKEACMLPTPKLKNRFL